MQYFGGKQRIAHKISSVINNMLRENQSIYIEPFVGGASIMSHIESSVRIGNDANKHLITMWRALSNGWVPPHSLSEEDYDTLNRVRDVDDPMTAFAGFGCSFAGKWFGGYARSGDRNYAVNAARSLEKKMRGLQGVLWVAHDYREDFYPTGPQIIYCDPPYKGTTQYGAVGIFNSEAFWDFCRTKHNAGRVVLVSEYSAPEDFTPILEIDTKTDIHTKTGKSARVEKLFAHRHYELWL